MSIFSLFQQAPANPSPAAASAATNNTVPNANTVPAAAANPSTPAAGAEPASPLDNYKDLWQPDPNAKPNEPFKFNSDPAKLLESAKTVDFTKVITPEMMAQINAGGPEAQKVMMGAMNNMTQMAFAQAAHTSAKITEAALQQQEKRFQEMLPTLIKQHTVTDTLKQTNPLMADPAMAPMITALQTQFTTKYPMATASEIQSHVNDFLNGAADRIAGIRPQPKDTSKRAEFDWSKFVEPRN